MIPTTTRPDSVVLSESTDGVGVSDFLSESSTSFFDPVLGHFQHQNWYLPDKLNFFNVTETSIAANLLMDRASSGSILSGSTFKCRFEDLTPSNRHFSFNPDCVRMPPRPSSALGFDLIQLPFDLFARVHIIPIRPGEKRVPKLVPTPKNFCECYSLGSRSITIVLARFSFALI